MQQSESEPAQVLMPVLTVPVPVHIPVPVSVPNEIPFNKLFHTNYSSVRVNCCGTLSEIRRGLLIEGEIQNPAIWATIDDWMHHVTSLGREAFFFEDRPIMAEWNGDQQLVADFTRHSTLSVHRVSHRRKISAHTNYDRALYEMNMDPTNIEKITHAKYYYNNLQEYYRDESLGGEHYVRGSPTVYVTDQIGVMKPIFMNLKNGVMGTTSGLFGKSFSELGIIPISVWAHVFGELIRVA
jgi:hypothetical protein